MSSNSSTSIHTTLVIILSISTFALLAYILFSNLSASSAQYIPFIPNGPTNRILGGCAGTRWGCCPDGYTARNDPFGTNC